jgi:hypothetical protein
VECFCISWSHEIIYIFFTLLYFWYFISNFIHYCCPIWISRVGIQHERLCWRYHHKHSLGPTTKKYIQVKFNGKVSNITVVLNFNERIQIIIIYYLLYSNMQMAHLDHRRNCKWFVPSNYFYSICSFTWELSNIIIWIVSVTLEFSLWLPCISFVASFSNFIDAKGVCWLLKSYIDENYDQVVIIMLKQPLSLELVFEVELDLSQNGIGAYHWYITRHQH